MRERLAAALYRLAYWVDREPSDDGPRCPDCQIGPLLPDDQECPVCQDQYEQQQIETQISEGAYNDGYDQGLHDAEAF